MEFKRGILLFASVIGLNMGVEVVYGQASTGSQIGQFIPAKCQDVAGDLQKLKACLKVHKEMDSEGQIENLCQKTIQDYNELIAKAKRACQNAGVKGVASCLSQAKSCNESDDEEGDGNAFANALSAFGGSLGGNSLSTSPFTTSSLDASEYKGKCLNRKDFRETQGDLKKELKDLEKEVSKLTKDITEAQKDLAKDNKKVDDKINSLQREARQEDLKASSEERENESKAQQGKSQAKKSKQQLFADILKAQGSLSVAISQRTKTLSQLSDAMASTNCMAQLEKIIGERPSKVFRGGQNQAQKAAATQKARDELYLKNCYQEMIRQREEGRAAHDSQIKSIMADIEAKQQEIKDIDASLTLATNQEDQAKMEKMQSKTQQFQERYNEVKGLGEEKQSNIQTTQQKILQFQQELRDANQKKNKASNQLAALGTKPAGEKSPTEAIESLGDASGKLESCKNYKKNYPNITCTCPEEDKNIKTLNQNEEDDKGTD